MSMSTALKLCDVKKNIECSEEVQKINSEILRINKEDVSENNLDINENLDTDFEQTLLDITEDDYLDIEECEISTEDEDKLLFDDSIEMSEGDGNIAENDECSSLPSSRTYSVSEEICDIQMKSIKEELVENFSVKSSSGKVNKCDILSFDDSTKRSEDKNIAKDDKCGLLTSKTYDISGLVCDMQIKSIKEGMIGNSEDLSLNCKSTDTKKCDNIFIEVKCSEGRTKGNKCDRLLYDDTSTGSSENKKNIAKDDEYNLLSSSKTSDISREICDMQMKSTEEDIIKDAETFSVKCSNNEANKCDDTSIEKKYSKSEIKVKYNNIFKEEKYFESQKNQTGKNVAEVISSKIVSYDKDDINSKKLECTSLNNEINAHTEKRVNDKICLEKNKILKCNSDSDCKKSKMISEKKIIQSVVIKKEINELRKEAEKCTDLTSASDKLPVNLKELHPTNARNEAVVCTEKKDDEILKCTSDSGCTGSTVTNEKKAIRSVVINEKNAIRSVANSVHKTTADSNASEKQNQNAGKNLEFNEDEKKDIEDPEWESIKNLTTTEERYKHVREVWQSATVPNPNKNLTYHSYRKKRIGTSKARIVKQHKRKATNNLEHPERKRSRPCTYIIDKCINSVMMEKDSKTNDIMAEMNSHIRQWEYSSQPNQYYQSYHSSYIYDLHAAYNQEIAEITNRYHIQVDQCDAQYQSKINELEKKRNEVYQFFNFYKGLDNTEKSDPTLVTEKQLQELEEIENMYKQFDKYYS